MQKPSSLQMLHGSYQVAGPGTLHTVDIGLSRLYGSSAYRACIHASFLENAQRENVLDARCRARELR